MNAFLYPLLSAIGTMLTGTYALFSPFIKSEADFIKEANLHISQIRGLKIKKITKYSDYLFNEKSGNNNGGFLYVEDVPADFVDCIDYYFKVEQKIKKNKSIYSSLNWTFIISIIISFIMVLLSILFNSIIELNKYLITLFVIEFIILSTQIIVAIILRSIISSIDELYQDKIFKEIKQDDND